MFAFLKASNTFVVQLRTKESSFKDCEPLLNHLIDKVNRSLTL